MFTIIRCCHLDAVRRPDAPELAEVLPLPTPDHLVEDRRLGLRIAAAIDLLPERQREAVWLVDVEQLTFAEAALVLDTRPGTVASRVARGRAALRVDLRIVAQERGIGG